MAAVTTATGRRIAQDSTGAGPPVLLLNGALAGRGLLAPLVADLAPHVRVLAPDLRAAARRSLAPAPSWPPAAIRGSPRRAGPRRDGAGRDATGRG
jgi:hypothetical protein